MYLKKIILRGFKSFADKTVFEFRPGITVITGPNGCGKSNVVDAIKWTLGEQSAKSLRGKEMQDVIFGGNPSRPKAEFAEVSLVFDNGDRSLPCDSREVMISRKLTRQGQSLYSINRKPARLRDLRDLLMDTGIGVGSYYVMEQGKIDHILSSNAKERRTLFEEAAQISKFKMQKKEALRRLERAEQNLGRLQDILLELENRLKGVRLQAAKARKYHQYTQEITQLKTAQAVAQYTDYKNRIEKFEQNILNTKTQLKLLAEKSQTFQSTLDELLHQKQTLEEEITSLREELAITKEKIIFCELTIQNETARLKEMELDRQRYEEEKKKNQQRIQQLQEKITQLKQIQIEQQQQWETLVEELSQKEKDNLSQQSHSQQILKDLEIKKSQIVELLHQITQQQNQLAAINSRLKGLEASKERLDDKIQDAITREQELLYQKDCKTEELQQIQEEIHFLKNEEETLKQEIQQLQNQLRELTSQKNSLSQKKAAVESRLEVLTQLEKQTLAPEAKAILQLKEQEKITGIHRCLLELIEVELPYAKAMEAALWPFLSGIVLEDTQTAKKIIDYLRKDMD
ncbi:MAG: hypothetical protein D6805_00430, partial [Planctomycetota bacterium]